MSVARDFWSRRRAKVERERAEEQRELDEAATQLDARPDHEVLAELGLPDPDDLQPGDDVTAFMARAVPQHLRNRALRKLWVSNPLLACLDGLNDYDDDYTGNGLAGGVLKTSYRVGKGLMAHLDEMERQASEPATSDEVFNEAPDDLIADLSDASLPEPEVAFDEPTDEADDVPPRPRRMAFQFEGGAA